MESKGEYVQIFLKFLFLSRSLFICCRISQRLVLCSLVFKLFFLFWATLPLESEKVKVKSLSHVQLFETSWTVTCKSPPSMGFSRQDYWSGLPFPSPGDLPDPGIEPRPLRLQADSLPSELPGNPTLSLVVLFI